MHPQTFFLVNSRVATLAIQAGAAAGQQVTLETLDRANPLQLWTMQAQVSDGLGGVAFVNPQTNNSVRFSGIKEPLIMQPFKPDSDHIDAWYVMPGDNPGEVMITYIKNTEYSWNDWGGHAKPGGVIAPSNGRRWDLFWTIQLAPAAGPAEEEGGEASGKVAVPAIAGEPAPTA